MKTKHFFLTLMLGVLVHSPLYGTTVELKISDYMSTSFTSSGITVSADIGGGAYEPVYNSSYKDLRVYAKGTLTISSDQKITGLEFIISNKGKNRLADLHTNTGTMTVEGFPNYLVMWKGSSNSITITVGDYAVYGSDGSSAHGQFDFTRIIVALEEENPEQEIPYPGVVMTPTEASQYIIDHPDDQSEHVIVGWVSYVDPYDTNNRTISFGLADGTESITSVSVESAQCYAAFDAPKIHDKICLKGKLRYRPGVGMDAWTRAGAEFKILDRAGDMIIYDGDFGNQGTENEGSEVSYKIDGVRVYVSKGYVYSWLYQPLRIYKGSRFEITSDDHYITKIRFTFGSNQYQEYSGGLDRIIPVNGKHWCIENVSSQIRISMIEFFYGEGNDNEGIEKVESDKIPCTKELRDGRLIILRGNKAYSVTGLEVR